MDMNFCPERALIKVNVIVFHRIMIPAELHVLFFIFSLTRSLSHLPPNQSPSLPLTLLYLFQH